MRLADQCSYVRTRELSRRWKVVNEMLRLVNYHQLLLNKSNLANCFTRNNIYNMLTHTFEIAKKKYFSTTCTVCFERTHERTRLMHQFEYIHKSEAQDRHINPVWFSNETTKWTSRETNWTQLSVCSVSICSLGVNQWYDAQYTLLYSVTCLAAVMNAINKIS